MRRCIERMMGACDTCYIRDPTYPLVLELSRYMQSLRKSLGVAM